MARVTFIDPFGEETTVDAETGSLMEAALAAAQSCPFLEINGALEVSEMIEMSSQPGESGSESIN